MEALYIKSFSIKVIYDIDSSVPEGYWENDKILIFDPYKKIKKVDIVYIIQYLYEEGFIQDRRTQYEIINET